MNSKDSKVVRTSGERSLVDGEYNPLRPGDVIADVVLANRLTSKSERSLVGANLHLSVHTVCVPDNERGRDEFYPGTLVYSAHLDRDIGELWPDDRPGMCWREVNDNLRPDRLAYGHASSLDDALAAVVRQAGQR